MAKKKTNNKNNITNLFLPLHLVLHATNSQRLPTAAFQHWKRDAGWGCCFCKVAGGSTSLNLSFFTMFAASASASLLLLFLLFYFDHRFGLIMWSADNFKLCHFIGVFVLLFVYFLLVGTRLFFACFMIIICFVYRVTLYTTYLFFKHLKRPLSNIFAIFVCCVKFIGPPKL